MNKVQPIMSDGDSFFVSRSVIISLGSHLTGTDLHPAPNAQMLKIPLDLWQEFILKLKI